MYQSDLLIIGSGIAGLTTAIKYAEANKDKSVLILTKADANESNTKYAQGGIAVVTDKNDSFDKHVQDTLIAGDGLCDEEVVRMVVSEGPDRLNEIIEWGTSFDKNEKGEYDLGLEGGHTENRVLHHKDITGYEIERTLLKKVEKLPNITLRTHFFLIDLITEHQILNVQVTVDSKLKCYGVYALNNASGKIETFIAENTVLATGGAGQVYAYTTNPKIATGDGVAVAIRAKAKVKNMQYVQFHPTALYEPNQSPNFLITEAIRGFGAYLRNTNGERFMLKYDERGEMASRDIVSQAIDKELKMSGDDYVYLDCNHLDKDEFYKHFPNIYDKCLTKGITITKDWIPIVPAAHYLCGGIEVDVFGRTNIKNLYANGECACTGLHGANRLASNSLLEALVYSHRIFLDLTDKKQSSYLFDTDRIPEWDDKGMSSPKELVVLKHNRKELQQVMSDYMAIFRSDELIEKAMTRLSLLYQETEKIYKKTRISSQLYELRNLITVADLITKQSINQKENRGTFYNVDNQKKVE